ncbi:ABC transporter ATP-binding protein [Paenibacillus sp. NPDC056722]|uniref:ABC transporter ATP-binding protein n=1 Tax=Paenibacillus sp. NPDC056722 TaxID=3345924 RepID=UPI003675E6E1
MAERETKRQKILDIRNLRIELKGRRRERLTVVDGISLSVSRGETLGIVGESGCGKSVLSLSMLGLLPKAMEISGGEIWYGEREGEAQPLHLLKPKELRKIRGREVAMVFQDPMSSLNNSLTIGYQVTEGLRLHLGYSRQEAEAQAIELFRKVGLARPDKLLKEYPHQLSGGMRQRVMIAIAIACNPGLLIADEPTTALDVTIQAQILEVMRQIRDQDGTSIVLISHDLGLIAEMCDRIAVMYAGRIVEEGSVADIFDRPRHPYTIGLLNSIPSPSHKGHRLHSIPGAVPGLHERAVGCTFAPRCQYAMERCQTERPKLLPVGFGHTTSCFLVAEEGVKKGDNRNTADRAEGTGEVLYETGVAAEGTGAASR